MQRHATNPNRPKLNPYGKELRAYNSIAEKYKSTHNERDLETGYDFRNARSSSSDAVRFNTLDPLAAQFPSWSPYNYVMSNPLRMIDPNGMRTYFVDQDGNHIYTSNDKEEDAITIVNDPFFCDYLKWIWDGENVNDSKKFWHKLPT
ncbi:MAG: hypothetical protein IPN94_10705 [Sphingobacteriales bacterium]|nr:hypothetical protein [Sphingobacteriales bacterium]